MSNDSCTNENKDRFSIVLRKQTKPIVDICAHSSLYCNYASPIACTVTMAGVEYHTIRLILLRKTEYVNTIFCLDLTIPSLYILTKTCARICYTSILWLEKLG